MMNGTTDILNKSLFLVLSAIAQIPHATQRKISAVSGASVGTVNSAIHDLSAKGLIADSTITSTGKKALEPYRIKNAIILAAGLSSRFAPISYEKPKGLLKVRGEILIERQIEQLIEAGIPEIIVVVGYKKEYFFYLEEKYKGIVRIVMNDQYATRNNHSSLMVVADSLSNSLICSSDDYFVENPFQPYAWKSFYSAEYQEGRTKEWCLRAGNRDRIIGVSIGGSDAWYMIGHAYFDSDFSRRFVEILKEEYDLPQTIDKLWEDLYVEHINDFDMEIKRYEPGIIFEFDSLDELRAFDPLFLENVDSEVFDNIQKILGCSKGEIRDIYPLKQGLTNLSCHFRTDDGEYVYRHPGVGTELLIDRDAEVAALTTAKQLGIDDTFIYEDPERGWKISRFIPNARTLDPHDDQELAQAMAIARKLHDEPIRLDRTFDFYEEGMRYDSLLRERTTVDIPGYEEMRRRIEKLKAHVNDDNALQCLTHNDFFYLNFLFDENDRLSLIDWEYAGTGDYANDFGTFVVCCELSDEEARSALEHYFGRKPTSEELRHNFAYIALAGWCWYVWSLLKEAEGDNVGNWLYIYYGYANRYLDKVLDWYENGAMQEKGD